MIKKIIVNQDGIRIDKYLVANTEYNRSYVEKLIRNDLVKLNNELVNKNGLVVNTNDVIEILDIIDDGNENKIEPYKMELDVKYEDESIIIINKKSGVLVHPTQYNENNTLMNGLMAYSNNNWIPHLVHRLDKDTSGLIIFAKNKTAQEKMLELFTLRKIVKKYYALVKNKVNKDHFIIDVPISRANDNKLKMVAGIAKNKKEAITEVNLIKAWDNYSLLDVTLHTGRTHQIRVHLQYIKHPIVNDPLYGNAKANSDYNQYLMAYYLKFTNPINNKEIEIKIDLEKEFYDFIQKIS